MVAPKNLGMVVAEGQLSLDGGTNARKITLLIGKTRKSAGHQDYFCPYQIRGIGSEKVTRIYGTDSLQGPQLAIGTLAAKLQKLNRDLGGRLCWLGEAEDLDSRQK